MGRRLQRLPGEHQHPVLQQRPVEGLGKFRLRLAIQIHIVDLSAQMAGQGNTLHGSAPCWIALKRQAS